MTTMPTVGCLQDLLIRHQLPSWLAGVSPESLSALNRSLSQQMQAEHEVQTLYKGIMPIDEFAASRLQQELHDLHQLSVDEQGQHANHVIEQGHRFTLEATARMAELKGEIDKRFFDLLVPVMSVGGNTDATVDDATVARPEGPVLVAKAWRVLGKKVRGAMAFEVHRAGVMEGVLCWVPGDAQGSLSWYESWNVFFTTLGKMFRLPGYDSFFQRFIGERDRVAYSQALDKAKASRAAHLPVELDGRYEAITQSVFAYMRQEQVATLIDNALLLAAPTADKDSVERDQRLHFYRDAGLSALGIASLFVPWLGLPLLAVMAYEIVDGIYEGFADWQLGDRQAALEHVLGVAEATVLVGVGVGAGVAAQRLLKSASFVRKLVPVPVNDSEFRLIHPDLPGYEVLDDSLAVGERAGEPGLQRLRTHAATYQVAQDPLTSQLTIEHPTRQAAYSPLLEQNGAGAWRHELEAPQQWQGEVLLFRRLGNELNDVPQQTIHDVLQITGFDEARLRRLHLENAAVPARLLDALQRYQLHQQEPMLQGQAFELRLSQRQVAPTAAARVLLGAFPGLTGRGALEIVGRASQRLVQHVIEQQKVPMQLAGEARWMLRDSRVDRASAGLKQTAAVNADTERLALGLLADIAPWPENVRVEVRDGKGRVMAKAGSELADEVRTIQREGSSYRAYDQSGTVLTNDTLGDSLFKALLAQVDERQKNTMGEAAASPAALAERLGRDAFGNRDRVAQLIGLQPLPNGLKPLVKARDGRLGYPLSGGAGKRLGSEDVPSDLEDEEAFPDTLEQGLRRLFPTREDATVQLYLRALRGEQANDPWPAYRELVNQVRALRRSLVIWRGQDVERTRIAQEVFDAWQPVLNGETPDFALDLDGQVPGGLPELPDTVDWGRLTRLTLRSIDFAQFDASLPTRLGGVRHLGLVDSAITVVPDWLLNLEQLVELDLRNNQLASLPEGLSRLSRLTVLNLAHNRFTRIPAEVGQLTELRVLNLENNSVVVDAQGRVRLARLHRLEMLVLSHNPVGELRSLPNNLALQRVSLRFTGLREFPAELFRQHAGMNLTLEGNRISELSPEAVRMIRRNSDRVNLDYNPLSASTVSALQAPEPVELAGPSRRPQVRLGEYPQIPVAEGENPWVGRGEGELAVRRRAQWQRLEAEQGAAPLVAFLHDLAQANIANLPTLQARVWAILDACELNADIRQAIFEVADTQPTCADQRLLLLSMMEVRGMAIRRLAGVPVEESQAVLLQLGRGLYRLDEVERIASRQIVQRQARGEQNIDAVEVALAYRFGLARSLDLPLVIDRMQFIALANVSPEDIAIAQAEVLAGENNETVAESLALRDFWQDYLRTRHSQQFDALDEEFIARMEALEAQQHPEGEFIALAGALSAERNARLNQLFLDLTRRAYQQE